MCRSEGDEQMILPAVRGRRGMPVDRSAEGINLGEHPLDGGVAIEIFQGNVDQALGNLTPSFQYGTFLVRKRFHVD